MEESTYSIAIRTLGTAGEKYKKLLKSIDELNEKPQKVVIVLPYGYALPSERLGYEDFVFSEKSMVQQRIEALKYIDSDYTLFLDDDIEFQSDFISKLKKALDSKSFDCATGPLFSFFPQSFAGKVAATVMGKAAFRVLNRGYYVRILRNGSWAYRYVDVTKEKFYPTESFAWTCFMIKTDVMRSIKMEEEIAWIERNGYAWGDDRVMAYKLVKNGYRSCIVSNALYTHNDAKTSRKNSVDSYKKEFCTAFFSKVFWYRFLQENENRGLWRCLNKASFNYSMLMENLYYRIKILHNKDNAVEEYKALLNGDKEADAYIFSDEYKKLSSIYVR